MKSIVLTKTYWDNGYHEMSLTLTREDLNFSADELLERDDFRNFVESMTSDLDNGEDPTYKCEIFEDDEFVTEFRAKASELISEVIS